jgi:Mn-dependent DtxR family transcriptional regulator
LTKKNFQYIPDISTHLRFSAIIPEYVEVIVLKEKALDVLREMNEISNSARQTDLNDFAQMVSLTPAETLEQMQELSKAELVKKTGGGYGITEKGRAALKAYTPVAKGKEFYFHSEIGQSTGFKAESIGSFSEIVKQVTTEALEFHLYRNDFQNWIRDELDDAVLADKLASIKNQELKGENLREEIVRTLEDRYGTDDP